MPSPTEDLHRILKEVLKAKAMRDELKKELEELKKVVTQIQETIRGYTNDD